MRLPTKTKQRSPSSKKATLRKTTVVLKKPVISRDCSPESGASVGISAPSSSFYDVMVNYQSFVCGEDSVSQHHGKTEAMRAAMWNSHTSL